MTPLCLTHFEKYNRFLPLVPVTKWPEDTLNARLKHLHRVKDRDMKLLAQLEHERPKKIDDVAGETIALVGDSFRGVSFLRLSEIKSNDKITVVHERISAEREKEIELKHEGYSKMSYVLGMIEKCKNDVEIQKRKIDRETTEMRENYQFVVKMTEAKIGETQTRLEKEQIEKHKLLNDPSETVRNAAQELYDRYLHASESARRRDQY